jgi:hypothetical protein
VLEPQFDGFGRECPGPAFWTPPILTVPNDNRLFLQRTRILESIRKCGVSHLSPTRPVVNSIYRDLEESNDRRPLVVPNVAIVSKLQEPALSLPDSLLWIFSRYFGAGDEMQPSYHLWFERLRDKYRHVVDVDSGRTFSRRHPIEGRGGNSSDLFKPQA